jgi:hypothetical protein
MNLFASFYMDSILASTGVQIAVADYVKEEEALTILEEPASSIPCKVVPVVLDPSIKKGLITIASLKDESESETYVSLASTLDDGEAITGAIAIHRGWAIATDERKATLVIGRKAPHVHIVSTPHILKRWADSDNPTEEDVSKALMNIHLRARYAPPVNHPLRDWWLGMERPLKK